MGSEVCSTVRVSDRRGDREYFAKNVAIRSKACNRVFDVSQDKDSQGMLIIYDDYKKPNQRFDIIKDGNSVRIICAENGNCLTVASNSDKNLAPIFTEPVDANKKFNGQKFRLALADSSAPDEYFIHTFCGKILDCHENETENGTRIVQFDCTRADDQKWIIKS